MLSDVARDDFSIFKKDKIVLQNGVVLFLLSPTSKCSIFCLKLYSLLKRCLFSMVSMSVGIISLLLNNLRNYPFLYCYKLYF